MLESLILNEPVEDNLDLLVLCDVLVFFIATMLAQQCFPIDFGFEVLDLGGCESGKDLEKFVADQLCPVKSLLMIEFLKILLRPGQNGDILRCKQPKLYVILAISVVIFIFSSAFQIGNLAMFPIFLEQSIQMDLGLLFLSIFAFSMLEDLVKFL